jgi:outer membrane protein assembly factor BamB
LWDWRVFGLLDPLSGFESDAMRHRLIIGMIVALAVVGAVSSILCFVRMTYSVGEITPSHSPGGAKSTYRAVSPGPDDWPEWRGANQTSVASNSAPPRVWSRDRNIAWETPLPGKGHSSPVVWDGNVFLTTAVDETGVQSVNCIDLADGHIRWNTAAFQGKLPEKHEKNTHASATPACDGEMVYAAFAVDDSIRVVALKLDGSVSWRTNVGPFVSQYGYGSSLALFGSLVIVDAESRGSKLGRLRAVSFMAALDRENGAVVWRIRRPEEHGFGSPVIGNVAGRDQLLIGGAGAICSYDPMTGVQLWACDSLTQRSSNSIAFDNNHVFASGTYPENEIICIRADGTGDVGGSRVDWRVKRGASGVPSPVVFAGRLYILQDKGVLSCIEADSGKPIWQKRLGGDFTASPVIAGGCLYAANEIGTTFVITLDDPPQLAGTNELDEPIFATPTPCGTSILLRTSLSLRKISEPQHVD